MLENENRISDASTEGFLRYYLTLFFYLKDIVLLINLNYIFGQENIWYTKKWVTKIRVVLFSTFVENADHYNILQSTETCTKHMDITQ